MSEAGEDLFSVGSAGRSGEEVTLDAVAAELVENGELAGALDTFRGAGEAECTTEVDDAADHGGAFGIRGDPVDEGLVDLHDADGQISQVAERGVPGPEVIDGKAEAE